MWSNEQKNAFAQEYALTCKMFNLGTIDPQMIVMVVNDLQDLEFSDCVTALAAYRKDSKSRGYPTVGLIRSLVLPKIDDDSLAVEAASRTVAAVSKFGWNKPQEAREYIGELGWVAVQRFGGWMFICENLGSEMQITTFQAQIRDLAKSILKLNKVGAFDQPVGIEAPPEQNQLAQNPILKLVQIKEV